MRPPSQSETRSAFFQVDRPGASSPTVQERLRRDIDAGSDCPGKLDHRQADAVAGDRVAERDVVEADAGLDGGRTVFFRPAGAKDG